MNYAVKSVGFKIAKDQQERLKKNLARDLGPIVDGELAKMGRDVSRLAIGLSNPSNPPQGVLSIDGRISRAMVGNAGPMKVGTVTGLWKERSKAYMKWKVRKYRTRRWFQNTGALQRSLARPGQYKNTYGPIQVRFTPIRIPEPTVLSLGRNSGGQSDFIMTGKLEVRPFRNLNINDLPQIGQKAGYKESLIRPWVPSIRKKLAGHSRNSYRPIIEPFLTYYMRRKIPNAVFRKIEDSVLR